MARQPNTDDLDAALRFDEFLVLPDAFDEYLDTVTAAVLEHDEVRNIRQDVQRNTKTAVSILLANLLKGCALSHHKEEKREGGGTQTRWAGGWVSLSLNQNDYVNTRYNNSSLSYRALARAHKFLTQGQMQRALETQVGFRDRERGVGRLTRIRLSLSFFNLFFNSPFRTHSGISNPYPLIPLPPLITNSTSHFPVSLLKHDLSRETIILKDNDKTIIPYEDTAETVQMRERLGAWNAFALTKWPDIFLHNRLFHALGSVGRADDGADALESAGETHRSPTDLTQRVLYRVFNNGSWGHGGRLYGGWWQHVPSRLRNRITINSERTVEIDFSNMQAAMLYARIGVQLPNDAYQLDGVDPRYRSLIKRTFFQMINARADQRIRPPRADDLPPGMTFAQLQEAIGMRHEAIRQFLRTGIGLELQKEDAEIALDVMTAAMGEDELVLPIHDSFIAREQYGDRLRALMVGCYQARTGSDIGVDVIAPYRQGYVQRMPDQGDGNRRYLHRRLEIAEEMVREEFSDYRRRSETLSQAEREVRGG